MILKMMSFYGHGNILSAILEKKADSDDIPMYCITDDQTRIIITHILFFIPSNNIEIAGINQSMINELWRKYPNLSKKDIKSFIKYRLVFAHILYDAICIAYSEESLAVTISEVIRALPVLLELKLPKALYYELYNTIIERISNLLSWEDIDQKESHYIS